MCLAGRSCSDGSTPSGLLLCCEAAGECEASLEAAAPAAKGEAASCCSCCRGDGAAAAAAAAAAPAACHRPASGEAGRSARVAAPACGDAARSNGGANGWKALPPGRSPPSSALSCAALPVARRCRLAPLLAAPPSSAASVEDDGVAPPVDGWEEAMVGSVEEPAEPPSEPMLRSSGSRSARGLSGAPASPPPPCASCDGSAATS